MTLLCTASTDSGAPRISQSPPDVRGTTIAEALQFLKKAKRVYVVVPTGFDHHHHSAWHYCRISKAEARRHLTASYFKSESRFSSRFENLGYGDTTVYLGSFYDETRMEKRS